MTDVSRDENFTSKLNQTFGAQQAGILSDENKEYQMFYWSICEHTSIPFLRARAVIKLSCEQRRITLYRKYRWRVASTS